ncbi:MAG: isoamylase [Umezawaea sp.]
MTARTGGTTAVAPPVRGTGLAVTSAAPYPLGSRRTADGIAFAVRSSAAREVSLVLFRRGASTPFAEVPFPPEHRVGGVHAMTVAGLDPEAIEYGYRVTGPAVPGAGDRFDPDRILADPYAREVGGGERWGGAREPFEGFRYRSRVVADEFDWEGDRPPAQPAADLVVYEAHVRGFTRHPTSGVSAPGTYAGMAEKVEYLRELGVTCVELLPVFEFDELANDRVDPVDGRALWNYWGYSTVGYFAPKSGYGSARDLKTLVKLLHRAGIEVVLDVVFNHTAEGDDNGPTISFRGLDNGVYYLLDDRGGYRNYSGTGNSVNANHPSVTEFVLDCLRHWVAEFHVDGFRFDLASALTRGEDGSPLADPPLLRAISSDPLLRDTKLIAEAWDAAGLYQVGSFPAHGRWAEWNGRYRDVVRRFLKGDPGVVDQLVSSVAGSRDLYRGRGPLASINFVTSHDGFTLADLFSYNDKHNERNGEGNRDGDSANHSWNCGVEGPTDDPDVLALRARQVRNALALVLLSRGIPMISAGDEFGRTQHGNNNAYCHDELSWLDWSAAPDGLIPFLRDLIAFRKAHPALRCDSYPEEDLPTGSPFESRLATIRFTGPDDDVLLVANSHWEPSRVDLPAPLGERVWRRFVDTSAPAGRASTPPGTEPVLDDQARITAGPRSVLVLTATPHPEPGGDVR